MLSNDPHLFKTFLACSISVDMKVNHLEFSPPSEAFIHGVWGVLQSESDETFLALESAGSGLGLMTGEVSTALNFAEMERCDVVVAYIGTSFDVAVELGWASALGKPIILLLDDPACYTPTISELGRLPGARVLMAQIKIVDGFPVLADEGALRAGLRTIRQEWSLRESKSAPDQGSQTSFGAFHSHGMLGAWLMGAEEQAAADAVIASRSLFRHYGPSPLHKADALEAEVARRTGVRHVLAVSSGSMALRCALHALRLRPGDEVVVPACTFVATANAVVLAGGIPVFAEIDASLGLDPETLESRITLRTVGVIAVHLQGEVCRIDRIAEVTQRHGLWLVEDAAQAFGCSLNGTMAGAFGDIGVFSLQAHKTITCGEGGLLVTNDTALAARARRFQDQGGEREGDTYPCWNHPDAGFGENHKITELQAAVALVQCNRVETLQVRMQAIHAKLCAALADLPIRCRATPDPEGAIPYALVVFAPNSECRRRMLEALNAAGVPADAAYAEPIYAMGPFIRWSRGEAVDGLPNYGLPPPQFEACTHTERLLATMVRIPLNPLYGEPEVQRISTVLAALSLEFSA